MLPSRRGQGWLPSIFTDFMGSDLVDRFSTTTPAVNIKETDSAFQVDVAAPGLKKEDFKIMVNGDNHLIISSEKREENKTGEEEAKKDEGKYIRREFSYSSFKQSLILPDNVEKDQISASMDNGVLKINLPKSAKHIEAQKDREIEIK